jgi:AraC family transcriptional regulator
MDWLERMNRAMEYIESAAADEFTYENAARIACCSAYHFQRMFPFITGIPLSEYIRRRRLSLAAFELQTNGAKVIDISLKYGYDSPEAFSRAFKNLHGISPVSARDKGVTLKAYPKMTFSITIKGAVPMNYRIEQKEPFEMFGMQTTIQKGCEHQCPEFAEKCWNDGSLQRLNAVLGKPANSWIHMASFDHNSEGRKFMPCNYVPPTAVIPDEFFRLKVPPLTWAIFRQEDCHMENMQLLWTQIYQEWFPLSNCEQVPGPTFEMYYGCGGDYGKEMHGVAEIWIPVGG